MTPLSPLAAIFPGCKLDRSDAPARDRGGGPASGRSADAHQERASGRSCRARSPAAPTCHQRRGRTDYINGTTSIDRKATLRRLRARRRVDRRPWRATDVTSTEAQSSRNRRRPTARQSIPPRSIARGGDELQASPQLVFAADFCPGARNGGNRAAEYATLHGLMTTQRVIARGR